MRKLLDKLHARMGDLWWYSLMIFVACRSGDVIQAFIGLWLVPKYVGPSELGAVLPLQQLSGLFAVPLAILATVFAKYVNTYATRGELGKVKSFIHDVLLASVLVFIVCIAVAYLVIPHFYVRLNVVSGLLTVLILASGFVGNIGSLLGAAQQGLKQFKMMSLQTLISAPIRLVTLLVAMPIRALSGYILGQTTPPACTSTLAAFSLRKDLRAIPSDPTWRRDLPEIWRYLWPFALCSIVSSFASAMTMTVYRQRLPEIESSAYYMLSRFSDIASFAGASIMAILFPLASEAHERGNESKKLLWHSIIGIMVCGIGLAVLFSFSAHAIFNLSTVWSTYSSYTYLLPILVINTTLFVVAGTIANYELACHRFAAITTSTILSFGFAAFLVAGTGYEFFRGILPDVFVDGIANIHLARLSSIIYANLAFSILLVLSLLAIVLLKNKPKHL